MELLSIKKRLHVIYLYFCGLSLDQIVAKTGISKGSVSNIIGELKAGNFPETADVTDQIETLRELAVNLAKLKQPVGQAVVGVAVLKRMYELGLDPSDMERWPLLLNSIKTQDDAQELIEAAYSVRGIQQETGLSLPALENKVKQLGEKAVELDAVTAKVGEAEGQLATLNTQKEKLTTEVNSLDAKFKWLVPRVQELEQREKLLLDRHEAMLIEAEKAKETLGTLKTVTKKLEKTGFSVKSLVDFNSKLEAVGKHHGIKASMVRERLLVELKHLDKGLGLETLVKQQAQTLKETNQTLNKRKGEITTAEAVLANVQQQNQNLEARIKATSEYVGQEIAKIVPLAQDTVKKITIDLKSSCGEVLAEVKDLKDEAVLVGENAGQIKAILAESEWIKKLVALQQGEGDVNATEVRKVALLVNRGINAWLGQRGAKSLPIQSLSLTSNEYVRKLEEWETQE